MGLCEAAEYLVLKALSNGVAVDALYDYFVNGVSPRDISIKYGITKLQLRGYVSRMLEKAHSSYRAALYMKVLYPVVKKIRPVVICGNDYCICGLCSEKVSRERVERHIYNVHRDIVASYLEAVLEAVKEEWNNNRMAR